jgi:hypothetical protein
VQYVEVIEGLNIKLSEHEYNALLEMGWSEDRYVELDSKIDELVKGGDNINEYAKRICNRFEGLKKRWTVSTHRDSDLVEFVLGSSAEFSKADYDIFAENKIERISPFGNFLMYGVLLVDKYGTVYEWGDWHHFVRLGSFEKFVVGMLNEEFDQEELKIKNVSELPRLWGE